MTILFLLLLILFLIYASAWISSAEVAFFSLSSAKIKLFKHDTHPRKQQIVRLLQQPKNLLVTIFTINTITNILVQNFTSDFFDRFSESWALKVGVPLFLVLLFGELIPKYLGLMYNERIAFAVSASLEFFHTLLSPFRVGITALTSFFSRMFFFFLKPEPPLSKEEIDHILRSSTGTGVIQKEEAELILGFLSLEEGQVSALMQPRNELIAYDIQEPLSKLHFLLKEHHLTQIPVFEKTQDNILGILDAQDVLATQDTTHTAQDLVLLFKKPLYIPQTTQAKSALAQLLHSDYTIALVIDEYGAIDGFVSEATFARFVTRFTRAKEEEYVRIDPHVIIADATISVEKINQIFNKNLTSKYHTTTLGGWICEILGTIPENGSSFTHEGLFFRILSAEVSHIKKVYIKKVGKP